MAKIITTLGRLLDKPSHWQVSQDINAFRTITTMLSVIQLRRVKPLAGPPAPIGSHAQRDALKIVDALATVLVMENDVVAVTAKYDEFGNINVFACAQNDPPTVEEPANPVDFSHGILKYLSSFLPLVTTNTGRYCRGNSGSTNKGPTITDPADYAPRVTTSSLDELEKLSRKDW
jgi:hypothetical protein